WPAATPLPPGPYPGVDDVVCDRLGSLPCGAQRGLGIQQGGWRVPGRDFVGLDAIPGSDRFTIGEHPGFSLAFFLSQPWSTAGYEPPGLSSLAGHRSIIICPDRESLDCDYHHGSHGIPGENRISGRPDGCTDQRIFIDPGRIRGDP